MKKTRYRVFNENGYVQSYNNELEGAFNWAVSCAKKEQGYVEEYRLDTDASLGIVFDARISG